MDTDVFIVGGGPAGLAAAIAARQEGFRVTVADISRMPIDKACGEGLMPDGVAALERLGARIDSEQAVPFRGIRFVEGEHKAEARFPYGHGLGIRRTVLHRLLVKRADEAGVDLHWGARVGLLSLRKAMLNDCMLRCRWIIGADGQDSQVRRWAGLDHRRFDHIRFGFRRHFWVEPWTDCVEVHWRDGCQIVVTPISRMEVCVAAVSKSSRLRTDNALALFPELSERLKNAPSVTAERGEISALRGFPSVTHHTLALVGDASGSVDALTGEGLCVAFQQAISLADALARGDLDLYQKKHRQILRLPTTMSRLMLWMDEYAPLRHRVLHALSTQPQIFSHLLATHVGATRFTDFGLGGALRLGWELLTA